MESFIIKLRNVGKSSKTRWTEYQINLFIYKLSEENAGNWSYNDKFIFEKKYYTVFRDSYGALLNLIRYTNR